MQLGACCAGPSSGQGTLPPCRRDGLALGQKRQPLRQKAPRPLCGVHGGGGTALPSPGPGPGGRQVALRCGHSLSQRGGQALALRLNMSDWTV